MPKTKPRPRLKPRRRRYPDLATYIAKTNDTQAKIARRLHLSQPTVSRIVNADVVPRSEVALRIAAYANVPLDSFIRTFLAKHGCRRAVRKVA